MFYSFFTNYWGGPGLSCRPTSDAHDRPLFSIDHFQRKRWLYAVIIDHTESEAKSLFAAHSRWKLSIKHMVDKTSVLIYQHYNFVFVCDIQYQFQTASYVGGTPCARHKIISVVQLFHGIFYHISLKSSPRRTNRSSRPRKPMKAPSGRADYWLIIFWKVLIAGGQTFWWMHWTVLTIAKIWN